MRILRLGCAGADVSQWQYFLTGCGFLHTSVTGTFDAATEQATKDFQRIQDLEDVDGVVGPMTLGAALKAGFNILVEDPDVEDGPDWPPRPTDVSPTISSVSRTGSKGPRPRSPFGGTVLTRL